MSENAYYRNPDAAPVRKFLRSRDDRVLAGVCGGAARFFGVDANLLRIILVVAAILGVGTGALIYLACWLLVPEEA
jgi:phage shock protein C